MGDRGYVTKDLIAKHLPPPSNDTIIFVCGPVSVNHDISNIELVLFEWCCSRLILTMLRHAFICQVPMYEALCGPRDSKELTGTLATMGYTAEMVFKF